MIFDRATISAILDYEPHLFYELPVGYLYPVVHINKGASIEIGRRIPVVGMFEISELLVKDSVVGYLFKSSFTIECFGGYLVAYLKGKGLVEAHEVVLKLDNLIIYNFPNHGTLVVSPAVSPALLEILESQ